MLILTRRVGEIIRIGPDVVVTVLSVNGSQVRIGVDAPKTVTVHREEVFERIKNERTTPGTGRAPTDVDHGRRGSS
jgi:carbon storage regulator